MSEGDEIRKRNKVRIRTKYSKNEVKCVDEYPREALQQQVYKYCCPICLRYFNLILISSCCRNYICRHCIGEMARRASKDKNFIIKCCHCFEEDYRLNDVKPSDEVKTYTDTPYKCNGATTKGHEDEHPYQDKQPPKLSSSKKNKISTFSKEQIPCLGSASDSCSNQRGNLSSVSSPPP